MKILVTGATGFIGSKLVPFLEAAGHDVIAPPRSGDNSADLDTPESYSRHMTGVDAVVHLAAFNPRAYQLASLNRVKMVQLNVDASAHLARLAARNGCKVFLFSSSARVYGIGTSPYSEDAPLLASDTYGQSKIEAERRIIESLQGSLTQPVIFRLPVFAEKPGGVIGLARKLASIRVPLPSGLMKARKSIIGIDTFCQEVLARFSEETPKPSVCNLADRDIITIGDLCTRGTANKPASFMLPKFADALIGHVPAIGYAWRHAVSDCVLVTSMLEAGVGAKSK